MFVLKHNGKIYGAKLTKAEEKAMQIECDKYIDKCLVEEYKNMCHEIDAIFLWRLHKKLGLGHKRLWEFYTDFHEPLDDMIEKFELEDDDKDRGWLCTHLLKEYGIDIKEWYEKVHKEREEKREQRKQSEV